MRIFSKGIRQIQRQINFKPVYQFSGSQLLKVQNKLHKLLNNELQDEQEGFQMDTEINEIIEQNGFQINDEQGKLNITAFKQQNGYDVKVNFQAKSAAVEEEEEQQEDQEEKMESETLDYSVQIVKSNKGISFDCSYSDGQNYLIQMQNIHDYESWNKTNKFERLFSQYNGPQIETLEEDVQKYLERFFNEYVKLEAVDAFDRYAVQKEQLLYMKWLENVGNFVQK